MRQSPMPPRKAEMNRGKPLGRGKGGLSRAVPQSTRRRRTGFSPKVKLMARTRAGGGDPANARCEAGGEFLGLKGGEVHHRLARGMGGSEGPVVNGITNAALLCVGHHALCTAKSREMQARGWWIEQGNGPGHDPRYVPVMVMSESGSGALQYLTASGTYSSAPPEEAAA